MLTINKITSDCTVDFAAEELKKYLIMMMPEGGDIKIKYAPEAKDGFRLGLMQDFGLDVSDVEEPELDDILYIDCSTNGGIIAGDNPRSVLLSVYEYLRQNGCRWLMPGLDGEYIPLRDIKPVKYRHKPSCRYRGWCNEGSESQRCMMETIDFAPKVGMSVYMMEFKIPTSYYKRYYMHMQNETNRPPEPVTNENILQWKRQCEAEIAKRGLQFHDMGHGWSADPFGIDSSLRAWDGDNDKRIPEESRKYLALVNGERKLVHNVPNYTQFCMSNSEARDKIVKYVADYAEKHSNVTYLHVWLGDATNKHCECEACKEKTPSDWYMILLNEIDAELTSRNLDTKIVFIAYMDTIWAPISERLKDEKRFSLLLAPISRSYLESLSGNTDGISLVPYVRNKLVLPKNFSENLAYFEKWKENWHGANLAYEYHFWRHQYYDVGGIDISKIINQDVKAYKKYDINGIIEDGSQRSFFPTGLAFYTYARTLFDSSLTYEEIEEDYFSHAFGEEWKKFRDILEEIGNAFGFDYLEGKKSADPEICPYYNPAHTESFARVKEITEKLLKLVKEYYNSPIRVQTVSVRILENYAEYCNLLAAALIPKAMGDDKKADAKFEELKNIFGRQEAYIEPFYDHGLAMISLNSIFSAKSKITEPITELGN